MQAPTTPDISQRTLNSLLYAFTSFIWICAWPYLSSGGASYGNDLSSHFAELQQIARLLRTGETDFWSDFANLGYPLFVTYQPLAGMLMGSVFAITQGVLDQVLIFKMSIIAVWSMMPWAWAWSARHLGLSRVHALFVGLLAVSVSDQLSFGLSWQSTWWVGLYSQMWGMLVFAPALAVMMRAVASPSTKRAFAATVMLSLVASTHFFLGMFAGMCAALWWVVKPTVRGLGILSIMAMGSAALCAFWLVPLTAHLDLVGGLPWRYANQDGHGVSKTLMWFVDGTYFDAQRVPWFGTLVFFGMLLSVARVKANPLARWSLLVLTTSLVLLLGKSTLGELYMRIPFHGELECIRYLSGVHLAGIFLAGIGLGEIIQRLSLHDKTQRILRLEAPRLLAILVIIGACGIAIDRGVFASRLFRTFPKAGEEILALSQEIRALPPSRILTHKRLGSNGHFTQIFVPVWLAEKTVLTSYGRGYHDTLNMFFVEQFDFSEAAARLFNVGGAIVSGKVLTNPPTWGVPLETRFRQSSHQLVELKIKKSWFEFVRTPFSVAGRPQEMREILQRSVFPMFAMGILPQLSVNNENNLPTIQRAGARWVVGGDNETEVLNDGPLALANWARERFALEPRATSLVENESVGINRFSALINVNQPGDVLLLKATWWPWWQWTARNPVFPTQVWKGTPIHLAPSMQGLSLPPGWYEVTFEFVTPPWIKILFGLTLAVWLSVALVVIFKAFTRSRANNLANG